MRDPFYSTPLYPLASVSLFSGTRDAKATHIIGQSSMAAPRMLPPYPQFFLTPPQMHGFGMGPRFPPMPFIYHPPQGPGNGGVNNPERRGHNAFIPMSNTPSLSDFHSLPQMATPAEPAGSGPRIVQSASAGGSLPTVSSSTGEVLTPDSGAEPPTTALVESPDLTYNKLLESYCNNNGWEINPVPNPDFYPFSVTGL